MGGSERTGGNDAEQVSGVTRTYRIAGQGLDLLTKVGGLLAVYLTLAAAVSWWPFAGPPDVRIDVQASHLNSPGSDRGSDEYVCLVNKDGSDVNLLGWVLQDAEGVVNQLPDITLGSGQQIRVHPGGGTDSSTDIYGEGEAPAWNNSGDTITLLDQSGERIDSVVYGSQSEEDTQASCGPS